MNNKLNSDIYEDKYFALTAGDGLLFRRVGNTSKGSNSVLNGLKEDP
jgi:hypothetical protein